MNGERRERDLACGYETTEYVVELAEALAKALDGWY